MNHNQMVREAYLREGPEQQSDEMLRTIAYKCAGCSRDYQVAPECLGCIYDLTRYMDGDKNRAMMYRIHARHMWETFNSPQPVKRSSSIGAWPIIFFIVVLLTFCVVAVNAKERTLQDAFGTATLERGDMEDWNGDGEVNCQDYAVMFYFTCWLMDLECDIVYNPFIGDTGHVFNRVKINGTWEYVEPQRPYNSRDMYQAWHNYNPKNNEIVTKKYVSKCAKYLEKRFMRRLDEFGFK